MQDQAAQLEQMGIPAAVRQQPDPHRRTADASYGEHETVRYRLLYFSPERLQRAELSDTSSQFHFRFSRSTKLTAFPSGGTNPGRNTGNCADCVRTFPDRPIAAFTASATQRVRHDILRQLEPARSRTSILPAFIGPTCAIWCACVTTCEHSALLLEALRNYDDGNVIVYSPTISKVEETVDFLGDQGIAAVGYHAKMDAGERRRNQERWMSDEVRVLVGTIAFGLGINKATVRAVIHLALPKSVEQFYQEAGRAGRDGNPADCILLWRKQDAGLLGYFANQILDAAERDRAWQRYNVIRAFVESGRCRHRQICTHFGETPKWTSCGGCDVCAAVPAWLAKVTTPALTRRTAVSSASSGAKESSPGHPADQALRDYLREWRRTTAKEQGVAAFVVLHDSSLDEICRMQPRSINDLLRITGIGERKAQLYGQSILAALQQYREGMRASATQEKKTAPALETLQLLAEGKTFEDIAKIRGRQIATVVNAVATLVEKGELQFRPEWIDRNKLSVIEAACERHDLASLVRLRTLKDALPPEITYDEIRLVLAKLRREGSSKSFSVPT